MTLVDTPSANTAAHASGGARAVASGAHVQDGGTYVDWPAILAGAVFAAALSLVMLGFGGAVGLSMTSPYAGEGMTPFWLVVVAGLWFVWVMVSSFGAAGYLAGRLRHRIGDASAPEVETRDGVHGLMVWATGALVGAMLAAGGVGGALGVGAAAADRAIEVATDADLDYYADLMLRGADIDAAAQAEIAAIVGRSVTQGAVVERDRAHVAEMIAARTALDPAAARARVDETLAEVDGARATALAAVERARVGGVVLGFVAAAALIVSAAAAYFAATLGGRHRDEGLGFDALPFAR